MAERPMDIYLNDHMAGAMLGSELAAQLRDRNEGTPLGELMIPIAAEIEEDRETLSDLMDALEVSRNPIKQAGGWVAEKWSRVKFSGAGTGDAEHGNFMAIESLTLGVTGKRCLWVALDAVRSRDEKLETVDLTRLIERANAQLDVLEQARLQAAADLLGA